MSGIGTKAQQESRNFHMKDNFKIWTENEKKGGSSQMVSEIFANNNYNFFSQKIYSTLRSSMI